MAPAAADPERTVRDLLLKLSRVAPWFYSERGAAELGRLMGRSRARPRGELVPGGETDGVSLRGEVIDPARVGRGTVRETDLERARLATLDAAGSRWTAVCLRRATVESGDLEGARVELVDAEELRGRALRMAGAALRIVSLREARLAEVDLTGADLLLVDLFGARLEDVSLRGATLNGCDLACSTLIGVDFSHADLRGANIAHADLRAVDLTGARVAGCDLRGVRGLTPSELRALRERGARTSLRPLQSLAWPLALRLARGDERRADRLAGWVSGGTVALVLAVAGTVAWRVAAPPAAAPGQAPVAAEAPTGPPPGFHVGEPEIAASRKAYHDLLLGIHRARATIAERGGLAAARWPTEEEVARNAFDLDGNGPGTATEPIVPGGYPHMLLSPSVQTVLPYCNAVVAQSTLSGDDSDWHYCASTGRLFACGAYTTLQTVEWAVEERQIGPDHSVGSVDGVPPGHEPGTSGARGAAKGVGEGAEGAGSKEPAAGGGP